MYYMGNTVCKKCGVEYSYYTKQGFIEYNRQDVSLLNKLDKKLRLLR